MEEAQFELLILCFLTLFPNPAGVASGATRAALTQHFALQNNAADISAKVSQKCFQCWMTMARAIV